ncbi:MAG: NupC/NupG family nucleoside CNT transporter [Gammaproteobacteria bacterium]|nr:NupC/NupG family nucleoside CNT transporter [Gammaproteobacteria bacterium]
MTGLIGICLLPLVAWLLSTDRKAVNWRTVGGAFGLQVAVGAAALHLPPGRDLLEWVADAASRVLDYSLAGIEFVFGGLASDSFGYIFAFRVLPVIIFFSALIAVLYYLRIMTWVVRLFGGLLQRVLHSSRSESISAAANVVVGMVDAPLVVRPFIPTMTRSELFAVMVGGLATVAGSVMAGYAAAGIDFKYLIAASFMAAPGGLMMAKLMVPETDEPRNDIADLDEERPVNIFDAAGNGAMLGLRIAFAVGAMLIAIIGLIALLNGIIGWAGGFVGAPELTFQQILGWLFMPVAWIIGVPWAEAAEAGSFIGQKIVLNEFVAYLDFAPHIPELSGGTVVIVTFALCGFANFGSVAILLGGLSTIAPNRREDIARFGSRALVAGTLANLMSASLAGVFVWL